MENGWLETVPESQIMTLDRLFSGEKASGVYRLDIAIEQSSLEALAKANDFTLFVLDGQEIQNKLDLFDGVAALLKWDKWGRNWDAFLDILRDVYEIKSKGVIFLFIDFQYFMEHHKEDFDLALEIFDDITHDYEGGIKNHPSVQLTALYVLLQTNADVDLPIEKLASDD